MRPAVLAAGLVAAVLCGTPAKAEDADASDWARSLKSSARLVDGGGGWAGVEIELSPGAITYWRNPGDSGAPPVFSFDGSTNLAEATPEFPAPKRIDEGDGAAFGYDGPVLFPIAVKAEDPAKPVGLALTLNYAACEKICVPAQAKLRLVLPPRAQTAFTAGLAAARQRVPRAVDWAGFGGSLVAQGANKWRLCAPPESAPDRDIFIEPPDGWWIDRTTPLSARGAHACTQIEVRQQPDGAKLPIEARLTITGNDPVETTLRLSP